MAIVGMILMVLGLVIGAVGGIWLLVVAFQESVLWGVGCLFLPLVSLIFVVMHWNVSKKPFLYNVGGVVLMILGAFLGAAGGEPMQTPS